jgi:hypothetical protein
MQDLAQSDDLEGLIGENHLGIVPTRAIDANLIVPDGLEDQRAAVALE